MEAEEANLVLKNNEIAKECLGDLNKIEVGNVEGNW